MANNEHVAILKQGVDVWNKWREDNPDVRPDLSLADLHEVTLRGAKLLRANLFQALLNQADLSRANLNGADLRTAGFRGANLFEAHFHGADLCLANLEGTDLRGADLREANLSSANLSNADLSRITTGYTVFADVDLSQVKGLDTIRHYGPSTVGIDTIYRSGGNIPEAFLRGCGVPDTFIAYMASLVGKPIEFYSCFISYSSKNQDFAERLYADLQAKGVRCWFAPEDLKIGDAFRQRIDEAIRLHDKLLLILSEHSVTSDWVEKEVETAFEQERRYKKLVLFPVRVDEAVMNTDQAWAADIRRVRHIGDFRDWKDHDCYQKAFDRLLRDLKQEGVKE